MQRIKISFSCLLSAFCLLFLSPSSAHASTYQDVQNFLNANPAPSGCVNWVEEVTAEGGKGYRVWQRCAGAQQAYYQLWFEGPSGWYVYNRNNRKCDGSNTWDYDHALSTCTSTNPCPAYGVTKYYTVNVYCSGSVTTSEKWNYTGDSMAVFSSPCLLYQSSSGNCRSYDTLLAEFTVVDQCLNQLTNTYESCAAHWVHCKPKCRDCKQFRGT